RIWEARPVGKGKLHLIFVGVGDRDYSVVRPHWASHPLPFLEYLAVGLKDTLADAGERFATPVCEFCDQLVNTFRWIHWIFAPRHADSGSLQRLLGRSFRNKTSKDVAFPHPQSRKDHYRKEDKPSCGGVVWKFFKRTINITEYRNAKDDVNPAKNRTCGGFVGSLGGDEGRLLQGRCHGVLPPFR